MRTSRFSYLASTIGKKQVVGVTGLGLSLFVLTHMLGNLLIFVGPEAYNMYSYKLISNPLIYLAEVGLLVLFIAHFTVAIALTLRNRASRTQTYAVASNGEKGTSPIQKTMWHQGIVILVFVVFHLLTFKFGPHYETSYDGLVVRDLHRLIIEVFQSPAYVVWYVIAVAILGFHLSHGFRSAFESLGFFHPRYQPKLKKISLLYAALVAIGFIAQPVYVFLYL